MEEQGKKNPGDPTEAAKSATAGGSGSRSRLIWIALVVVLVAIAATVFVAKHLGTGRKSTRTKVQEGPQQTHRVKKAISKMLRVEKPDWASPSTGMEFVWVPALNMWVGKYEVTNDEYQKKDPAHDSRDYKGYRLTGARQPVVYVNYDDACAYAEWLTAADKATGKLPKDHVYRLPSEDEWKIFAQGDEERLYP